MTPTNSTNMGLKDSALTASMFDTWTSYLKTDGTHSCLTIESFCCISHSISSPVGFIIGFWTIRLEICSNSVSIQWIIWYNEFNVLNRNNPTALKFHIVVFKDGYKHGDSSFFGPRNNEIK